MIQVVATGRTDPGLRRSNNEDAFLVESQGRLCALADGMGGAAAGELASRIFVETAKEVFRERPLRDEETARQLLETTFGLANQRMLEHVVAHPHHRGMGCTAEILTFHENGYVLGHVGDSRAYLCRRSRCARLTRDHSLVQDQLDQGLISEKEARKHPMRNVVLRAVGVDPVLALDVVKGVAVPSDIFLLCTDGLTDMVEDAVILEVLSAPVSLEAKAEELIAEAKRAGGWDNITVVLAEVLPHRRTRDGHVGPQDD